MKFECLKFLSLILFGSVAHFLVLAADLKAEPNDTTKMLMSENASYFDIGMIRLLLHFQNAAVNPKPSVHYNSDSDQIEIVGWVRFTEEASLHEADRMCVAWFKTVRENAGIVASTGAPKYFDTSNLVRYFTGFGYGSAVNFGLSSQARLDLDSKFHLILVIPPREDLDPELRQYQCSGALLDNTLTIERRFR